MNRWKLLSISLALLVGTVALASTNSTIASPPTHVTYGEAKSTFQSGTLAAGSILHHANFHAYPHWDGGYSAWLNAGPTFCVEDAHFISVWWSMRDEWLEEDYAAPAAKGAQLFYKDWQLNSRSEWYLKLPTSSSWTPLSDLTAVMWTPVKPFNIPTFLAGWGFAVGGVFQPGELDSGNYDWRFEFWWNGEKLGESEGSFIIKDCYC